MGVEKNTVEFTKKNDKIFIETSDALSWLRGQPNSSFDFVSTIHVIEHLEFSYFYELVGEIKRVLRETGVILFETPNPDNMTVATKNFYTDPTHLRPVPAGLADFVLRDHGFSATYLWGVNEPTHLGDSPNLQDVLGGASPDYAMFGLFDSESFGGKLDEILKATKGRSTKQICDLFELRYGKDYTNISNQIAHTNDEIVRLRDRLERELEAIYKSKSWRITAPIRLIAGGYRKGIRILSNAFTIFKNDSLKEFLKRYVFKMKRFFKELFGEAASRPSQSEDFRKGAFFEKYKQLLNTSIRKKKK